MSLPLLINAIFTQIFYFTLYLLGNDWGCDADGTCGLGHGPEQEKFYSCADIAITSDGAAVKTTALPTTTTAAGKSPLLVHHHHHHHYHHRSPQDTERF